MADVKITALTAISANPVNPATFPMPMVDLLDTSQAASGSTRKVTVNQILGAGGTATLASATITGAATVGTTLGVTGVATFASSISAVNDATVSGTGRLTLGSASGNAGARLDLRGWSSANANWRLSSALYGNGLDFTPSTTAGGTTFTTPAFSMLSSGDLSMALGNVVMATPGKGIDFSAVTGGTGTATANVLNDYEEGTWTIGLTFGGGNTGLTTALNTGRYTKIGRQVTVCGRLELSNKGSSTGAAVITGLPFSIANATEAAQAASFRFNGVSYTGAFQGYGSLSGTTIPLEQISEAGSPTDLTNSNFVNGTSIQISLTYTV